MQAIHSPAGHLVSVLLILALTGCSSTYYSTMEKAGIHKRDILVDRVENATESQTEAQEQFQSALDQFESVVGLEETDLKNAYDKFNKEYKQSESAAAEVSDRIDGVESVAKALFKEWRSELDDYQNSRLRAASEKQLDVTRERYGTMIASMRAAEKSMEPVLRIFHDNVLFLKHNLNAQAIGSLEGDFESLKLDVASLVAQMNDSIEESNRFIANMNQTR